nr:universal stress protein [uncultured Cupriavidus sp.]
MNTGAHGHTESKRVVLGSVAEELLRHCSVPVLVVRKDMDAPGEQHDALPPQHEVARQ